MFQPRWASRAQPPPPTKIRKLTEQNLAKSVRVSLTMYQNPWFGRNNSGIFVVAMAAQITIRSGTAAALVQRPSSANATDDFKRTYKVCGEVRVRKSDLRETNDAHVRVDVLENALGQKNQSHGKANQQDTGRALRRSEEEME